MADSGSPKWRTLAFRDSLLLHLHKRGLRSAAPALPDVTGRDRTMLDSGVIDGLPGFAVAVHRQQSMELASSLDAATELAASTGKPHAACVHFRRSRSLDAPGASYVVMTLDDFADVLLALDVSISSRATAAVG